MVDNHDDNPDHDYGDAEMPSYLATVELEFWCRSPEMMRDRIIGIPFGDHDMGFRIVSIKQGELPADSDECEKPEYRQRHGLPTRR